MNKNWTDKADRDLFFTILSVKNIGVISGSEWATIGTHMRSLGYGFTNEGCRQHFQGLRRAQAKAEASIGNGNNQRRIDPNLNPITRRPGPGRGRPRKQPASNGDAATTPVPAATAASAPDNIQASAPGTVPPPHGVEDPAGAPAGAALPLGAAVPQQAPHSQMQAMPPAVQLHPQYPGPHGLAGQPHPYAVPGGPGGPPPQHPIQAQPTSGGPQPFHTASPAKVQAGPHAGAAQMGGVGIVPQAPQMTAQGPNNGLPNVAGHDNDEEEENDDGPGAKRRKLEQSNDNGQDGAAAAGTTSAEDEAVLNALAAHNGSGNQTATPAEYASEYTYGDV